MKRSTFILLIKDRLLFFHWRKFNDTLYSHKVPLLPEKCPITLPLLLEFTLPSFKQLLFVLQSFDSPRVSFILSAILHSLTLTDSKTVYGAAMSHFTRINWQIPLFLSPLTPRHGIVPKRLMRCILNLTLRLRMTLYNSLKIYCKL